MLHAPPQLVCLGRVEYYDYDDRPAGVCNFAPSSASPDVWLGSRPRGSRAPPEGQLCFSLDESLCKEVELRDDSLLDGGADDAKKDAAVEEVAEEAVEIPGDSI